MGSHLGFRIAVVATVVAGNVLPYLARDLAEEAE